MKIQVEEKLFSLSAFSGKENGKSLALKCRFLVETGVVRDFEDVGLEF